MSPSGAKQKGKKFEEKIAAEIHQSLMASNKEYRELFEAVANDNVKPKRDAASGNFKNSDGDVDLGMAKKYFPFSIEAKFWKSLDLGLNSMLQLKIKTIINVWHDQALPKSIETGLLPLIVFRANRTEDFCFFDKNVVKIIPLGRFIKLDNWIICLFKDFVNEVNRRVLTKEPPFDKSETV